MARLGTRGRVYERTMDAIGVAYERGRRLRAVAPATFDVDQADRFYSRTRDEDWAWRTLAPATWRRYLNSGWREAA